MPNPLNFFTKTVTLASSVPQFVLPIGQYRSYLSVQNVGTGGPLTIGFSTSPKGPGLGASLDPATSPGGQGGSWVWDDVIPMNSIYLYSASGTIAVVIEGT
ncbi:hypothetical protein NLM31_21010 [Bradyrhizobium sp. CCGUVB4N]|uniref:hypothetical protein n=1 Tax=Bradyrhizobium sp. CCGUVB4N TaxID=2949631 RepID=UPI0020B1C646|nr:hypothetical protein [Bradyrhizobium sp. CCGUVB4N]MCP3382850.1 hypothetical protein [Bradyrhizobium sp. CCGUVB4N]